MSVVGTEVGRITVKVTPDTTGFRYALKKQLEALDRPIQLDVDSKGLKSQIDRATKDLPDAKIGLDVDVDKAIAKAQKAVSKPLAVDIKPKVKGLDRFQQRYLAKIQKLMSEVELNIPLAPDGEKQREKFKRLEKNFNSKVKSLDLKADEEELARLRRGIDKFYNNIRQQANNAKLLNPYNSDGIDRFFKSVTKRQKVEVDLQVQQEKLDDAIRLANQASHKVKVLLEPDFTAIRKNPHLLREALKGTFKIEVDVDADRIERSMAGILRGASGLVQGAGAAASALGSLGSAASSAVQGFARLPQGILLTVAVLALLPPALALISGSLVTIPGLLAGLFVPMGTVALGLDGIKKAAEAAGLYEDTNGAKKGGGSLGAALQGVKEAVSEVFAKGLVPAFRQIGDLFPSLTSGFEGVAQGLVDMTKGFTQAVADNLPQVQNTIKNIGKGLSEAAPGIQHLTDGLINLADQVAARFPNLGKTFSGMMENFSKWVDEISTKDPATGVSALDTALKNIRESMREIGGTLLDMLKQGFKDISDPEFGQKMVGAFQSIRSFVTDTLPTLTEGFKTLANLLQILKPIGDLFNLLGKVPGMFGPLQMIDQLKAKFSETLPTLSVLVGTFFTGLSMKLSSFVSSMMNLPSMISTAFSGAFSGLSSVVSSAFSGVVTTVVGFGSRIIGAISGAFNQIPGVISGIFSGVISTVSEVLGQVVASIANGGAQAVAEIATWPGKFTSALGDLGGLLVESGRALVQGFVNGIKSMIGSVADAARAVVQAARNFFPFSPAKEGPFSGSGWVDRSGASIAEGFADGLSQKMDYVVSVAQQLMDALQAVFGTKLAPNFNLQNQMSGVAASAQSFERSMTNAVNPAKKIDATSKSQISDLTRQIAELEMERKALELERANDKNNPAIKARLEEIRQQKLSLGLQKDQLNYAAKYGGAVSEVDEIYGEQFKKLQKMPWDVGLQAGREMLSDFGIEGQGAISGLVNQGLDYASKFIFNVSNVDEAMAVQRNQTLKESQQFITR